MAVVQAGEEPGRCVLTASAPGLKSATMTISVRNSR
jgi:hypothetical protein